MELSLSAKLKAVLMVENKAQHLLILLITYNINFLILSVTVGRVVIAALTHCSISTIPKIGENFLR